MLKELLEEFIKKQFEDLDGFIYSLEEEDSYAYLNFSQIMGLESQKEMTFKIIDNKLYYHSLSYGWKVLSYKTNNKYFWIDLINKD